MSQSSDSSSVGSSGSSDRFSDFQTESSSSEEIAVCRYCFEVEGDDHLIKPCECRNKVHQKCLQKWLEANTRDRCEICHSAFLIRYESKTECRMTWGILKNKFFQALLLQLMFWAIGNHKDIFKYQVSVDEYDCFPWTVNFLYVDLAEMIFIDMIMFSLLIICVNAILWLLFWMVLPISDEDLLALLSKISKRWVVLGVVILINGLIYLLGNLLLPVTIPSLDQEEECLMYDQAERIDYQLNHRPIFNWLTWYLGFYTILVISGGLGFLGMIICLIGRILKKSCTVERVVITEIREV